MELKKYHVIPKILTFFLKTITWLLKQEKQPLCRKDPEVLTSYPKSLY